MLTRTWTRWALILLAVAAVGGGLFALLWFQDLTAAANAVSIITVLLAGVWTLRGLYVWRETPWVRRVNSFVITIFIFGTAYLILNAAGAATLARTTLYLFGTVAGYMLGINLLRLILQPGWPVLGVARAMIEEATRMKVVVVLVFSLLVLLPFLPLILSSDDRLTYIVQRFLTYSLIIVSFVLSTLTVALAAYTTSGDMKNKLVYMSLTKPLSRWQYLLGKWLGVVLLNAVLLAVSGIAIAGFTRAIADGEPMNDRDAEQVQREVLTSRVSQIPQPTDSSVDEMTQRTLEYKQPLDPERYGEPGTPASALPERIRQEVMTEALGDWFTVQPGESATYSFTGLDQARANADQAAQRAKKLLTGYGFSDEQAQDVVDWQNFRKPRPDLDFESRMTEEQFTEIVTLLSSEQVQFVFTPYTRPEPDDGMVELYMRVNNQPWPVGSYQGQLVHLPMKVAIDTPQEMSIPAWLVDEDGGLDVEVTVPVSRRMGDAMVEQTAVQLNRKDAVPEVFYRVGTFDGNIARAMVVLWVRLAFLAMFGLICGSLFSFPVAALLGMMVYIMAAFSSGLSEAVSSYAAVPQADTTWAVVTGSLGKFFVLIGEGAIVDALKLIIGFIAKMAMLLVPSYGEFNPGPKLAEGVVVPNSMIFGALIRVGLLWTGVVTALGLFLFYRRELAKVTV